MNKTYKMPLLLAVFMLLCILKLHAQLPSQAPPDEPRKVKVQLMVNGKVHPPNQTLTKDDTDVKVRVFSIGEDLSKELAITNLTVMLMRNGQRISSVSLPGYGSISALSSKAKNNDIYLFELREIYEEQPDASLKKYTKGSVKVKYWFYDATLEKNAQQVVLGAN
jgi:hypothetical protein